MKPYSLLASVCAFGLSCFSLHGASSEMDCILAQSFALAGPRASRAQTFVQETVIVTHAPDGTRGATDIYRLHLEVTPAPEGSKKGDSIRCLGFELQMGAGPFVSIPALKGFSYLLDVSPTNGSEGRPVLGIPHEPFEKLSDAQGNAIPQGQLYHVYNAFADFHSFCHVFVASMGAQGGIEDLTTLGQKIVHGAADSEVPVNLGQVTAPGSVFKNGEVTLELKGLGKVEAQACALLGVDSGRSYFLVKMRVAPEMEVTTKGSSRYEADIYLDLNTHWVRRVAAREMVVSETVVPGMANKISSIIERTISVKNLTPLEKSSL